MMHFCFKSNKIENVKLCVFGKKPKDWHCQKCTATDRQSLFPTVKHGVKRGSGGSTSRPLACDVYAMAETNAKYIIRGSLSFVFKFLRNAERDFENLFNKLEELETFFDIKTKRRLVAALTFRRDILNEEDTFESNVAFGKQSCLPKDFPHGQMQNDLNDETQTSLM